VLEIVHITYFSNNIYVPKALHVKCMWMTNVKSTNISVSLLLLCSFKISVFLQIIMFIVSFLKLLYLYAEYVNQKFRDIDVAIFN
jgi:hypothetical protein